jgi:hypothetical protein
LRSSWNRDGVFNQLDIVLALQTGRYASHGLDTTDRVFEYMDKHAQNDNGRLANPEVLLEAHIRPFEGSDVEDVFTELHAGKSETTGPHQRRKTAVVRIARLLGPTLFPTYGPGQ